MAVSRIASDIIIAPVITERANDGLEQGKYTFRVAKCSNKIEIRQAVEELFPGIKIAKVNTMNVRGQQRRRGRTVGYTAAWKKAIVTLAEDSKKIEFFESLA